MAFPAREIAGQIWVYTGREPAEEPVVDEVFLRPEERVTAFSIPLATHWTRAMENMLDWPHLPFVHKRTIGRAMVDKARASRMDIEMEENDRGFTSRIRIDGAPQPGRLDYRFPNVMNLFIGVPRRTLVMQVACVPETDDTSRMVVTTARDFAKLGLFDAIFRRQNLKIVGEDKAVVESSFPARVPPAADERSVRTDAPTLAFRKAYFARLHGSELRVEHGGAPGRPAVDVDEGRLVRRAEASEPPLARVPS
jgi:phenylpropionate dioxygenase-like ring-hydroxylating dioxygenase large terminal subunit